MFKGVIMKHGSISTVLLPILALGLLSGCATHQKRANANLSEALTFHASFDNGLDADFATGDATFRHGPSIAKQAEAKPGLPDSGEVQLARDAGRFGHA